MSSTDTSTTTKPGAASDQAPLSPMTAAQARVAGNSPHPQLFKVQAVGQTLLQEIEAVPGIVTADLQRARDSLRNALAAVEAHFRSNPTA